MNATQISRHLILLNSLIVLKFSIKQILLQEMILILLIWRKYRGFRFVSDDVLHKQKHKADVVLCMLGTLSNLQQKLLANIVV